MSIYARNPTLSIRVKKRCHIRLNIEGNSYFAQVQTRGTDETRPWLPSLVSLKKCARIGHQPLHLDSIINRATSKKKPQAGEETHHRHAPIYTTAAVVKTKDETRNLFTKTKPFTSPAFYHPRQDRRKSRHAPRAHDARCRHRLSALFSRLTSTLIGGSRSERLFKR